MTGFRRLSATVPTRRRGAVRLVSTAVHETIAEALHGTGRMTVIASRGTLRGESSEPCQASILTTFRYEFEETPVRFRTGSNAIHRSVAATILKPIRSRGGNCRLGDLRDTRPTPFDGRRETRRDCSGWVQTDAESDTESAHPRRKSSSFLEILESWERGRFSQFSPRNAGFCRPESKNL